jgi:hypothetical protein
MRTNQGTRRGHIACPLRRRQGADQTRRPNHTRQGAADRLEDTAAKTYGVPGADQARVEGIPTATASSHAAPDRTLEVEHALRYPCRAPERVTCPRQTTGSACAALKLGSAGISLSLLGPTSSAAEDVAH